jgi:hypothetical protein
MSKLGLLKRKFIPQPDVTMYFRTLDPALTRRSLWLTLPHPH